MNRLKPFFYTILLIAILPFIPANTFSQIGRYGEKNSDPSSPLTIFSKKQGLITDQLEELRTALLNNRTLRDLYIKIYINAKNVPLSVPTNKKAENPNARTAKNAAFVYLIGLKVVNDSILVPEDSLRRHLDKVLTFFEEREGKDGKYFKCDKDWFDGTDDPVNLARGKELTLLLQAYDLIKTAYVIGLWTGPDATERIQNIRGKQTTIRKKKSYPNLQRFVRNQYQKNRQLGSALTWRDNQTLIIRHRHGGSCFE